MASLSAETDPWVDVPGVPGPGRSRTEGKDPPRVDHSVSVPHSPSLTGVTGLVDPIDSRLRRTTHWGPHDDLERHEETLTSRHKWGWSDPESIY